MIQQEDKERVKVLLVEAIRSLCKSGLPYEVEFCIEGLLGVTLDHKDVFLININETIRNEGFPRGRSVSPSIHPDSVRSYSSSSICSPSAITTTDLLRKFGHDSYFAQSQARTHEDKGVSPYHSPVHHSLVPHYEKKEVRELHDQISRPTDKAPAAAPYYDSPTELEISSTQPSPDAARWAKNSSPRYDETERRYSYASEGSRRYSEGERSPVYSDTSSHKRYSVEEKAIDYSHSEEESSSSTSADERDNETDPRKGSEQSPPISDEEHYSNRSPVSESRGFLPSPSSSPEREKERASPMDFHKGQMLHQLPRMDEIWLQQVIKYRQMYPYPSHPFPALPNSCLPLEHQLRIQLAQQAANIGAYMSASSSITKEAPPSLSPHQYKAPSKVKQDLQFAIKKQMSENGSPVSSNSPVFTCAQCGKNYSSDRAYKDHARKHKGEYYLHCPVCGKGFLCRRDLKGHMSNKHASEKEFKCQLCRKEFGYHQSYRNHMKFVHKVG